MQGIAVLVGDDPLAASIARVRDRLAMSCGHSRRSNAIESLSAPEGVVLGLREARHGSRLRRPPGIARPSTAAERARHPGDLPLGHLREERQRDRPRSDVLADRKLALAMAEPLAVVAHQVDRGEVRLARDAALARAPAPSRRGRRRAGAGRRTRTSRAGRRRGRRRAASALEAGERLAIQPGGAARVRRASRRAARAGRPRARRRCPTGGS